MQTVGGSLVNVGATIGGGALVGGGIGKLASLTPYKPKPAELEYQFKDMFQRAVNSKTAPDYIKNAGGDFLELFKKGQKANFTDKLTQITENKGTKILNTIAEIAGAKDKVIESEETQKYIRSLLKNLPTKIEDKEQLKKVQELKNFLKNNPDKALTKEQMLDGLKAKFEMIGKFYEKRQPSNIDELASKFAEKASKNERMTELATKGVKHLRGKAIIGVGVGVGIIGALALNILKTYGVLKFPKFGKNKTQQNAMPANISPEMLAKLQQMQALQGQTPAAK